MVPGQGIPERAYIRVEINLNDNNYDINCGKPIHDTMTS